MEFGRVSEEVLSSIDFSLPKEPVFNTTILSGTPTTAPKIYLGCAKWGRPERWVKFIRIKQRKKIF